MKYITLICIAAQFITACSSPQKKADTDITINGYPLSKTTDANNNTATVYSLHFVNKQGPDSTIIDLLIHGDQISGLMDWFPYQKDSRSGVIEGTLKNDTISAIWGFMQEGEKDTLGVKFLFKNNHLSQKPLKLNTKTGRQQTDEAASYSIKYKIGPKIHR